MSGISVPVFTWLDAVMFLVVVAIYVTLFAVGPDLGPKEAGSVHPISGKPTRKDESRSGQRRSHMLS
jgi:hypothetical protein